LLILGLEYASRFLFAHYLVVYNPDVIVRYVHVLFIGR